MVISNVYSSSYIMQWSTEEEHIFSSYMYSLTRVIMAWWRSKLGAETNRCVINIFKKRVGCNMRFFRFLWLIPQRGCSIWSLSHSCFKRPAYQHSQIICTYSDLKGHAGHHDVSILTPPTIVVARLLGCDTLSLDEYFRTFRRHVTSLPWWSSRPRTAVRTKASQWGW